ncbi:piezo-type mechanosensitive ion channel component 2-like [Dasypus novemcinctus]|uniref:piezo-type mechanosensitive ion channel component 2-like n=1 Tax=Dasypus novemcinctus TaxID=9361 RepID=UPI0039C8E7D7
MAMLTQAQVLLPESPPVAVEKGLVGEAVKRKGRQAPLRSPGPAPRRPRAVGLEDGAMAVEGAAGTLVWVLLPCGLLSAVLLRYSVLSAVYLALLLLTPLFCSPAARSVAGSTRHFLRVVGYTGVLFLLLQGALQLAFGSVPPDGAAWEQVLEHFGIVRFSRVDAGNIVRLLAPDVGVALVALVIARRSDRLLRSPGTAASSSSNIASHEEQEADGEWDSEDYIPSSCWEDSAEKGEAPKGLFQDFVLKATALACGWKTSLEPFFSSAGKVLVTLLLGLAGMLSPSVTSAVYFGAFLGLGSWWACRRALSALAFSALCVFMAIFTAGHLGSLYLYQLPFFQDLVPPDDLYARLLGMSALVRTTRTEPGKLHLHPGLSWPEIASPLVLLLSYYTLVFLLRQGAREPAKWEVTEELPGRLPSRGEELELCSVPWASGSEEDQGTPFSSGSWQELPLLHRQEHRGQCSGVDSPAFPVPGKRETVPGPATSPPDSGANGSTPSSVSALGHLAMRHSYVPALIAMMAWSVTHASWLSFVLLLWACVVWMARDCRRLALLGAPCLVLYANLLLLLAFAAGLRASREELFPGVPGWLLADLDLRPYAQPSLHLGAKSFYAFFFWLLLRQQVTERQMSAEAKEEAWGGETGEASDEAPALPASSPGQARPASVLVDILGPFLKGLLVKYWIFVCGAMFFVVAFHGKVVVYKIIYIFLFLTWVALYKLHYTAWRRTLRCFWVAVVFYSMVVLTAVYTYQFHTISGFFNQTLGLSKEGLHDMGLEQFDTTELFAKVLLPAAFLLACILQLHYFNEDFLKTTSLHNIPIKQKGTADSLGPNREEEATQDSVDKASSVAEEPWKQEDGKLGWKTPAVEEVSSWDLAIDRLAAGFLKLLGMVNGTQAFLWRFLEIHILKIVSAAVVWLTLQEVSLMNVLFYISWVASQPYSRLRLCTSHLSTVWACVIVICKMLYQLRCVVPSAYSSNCSEVQSRNRTRPLATLARESVLYLRPVDPAEWLGSLRKCDGQVLPCLKSQLVILALVTLEVTVRRRQTFHRLQNGLPEPPGSSITAAVTRGHLDARLLSALQYFVNYGFYKFGLELCFVAALATIGQRMDVYSFIHAIGLMYLLSLRRRKAIAEVWPRYCGFLVSLMILQYFLCLGLPPAFCKDDFLLLLAASLQGQVFVDENSASVRMRAGDNLEISRDLRPEDLAQLSPGPGFIFCQSYLDMAKVAVFRYHFWLVLGLVFLAGTVRIHVFGAGYLVAFGYFLGRGRRLLSKPVKFALRPWDRLIAYSVSVVALKTLLSVGACVYLGTLLETHCWLVHSFGMYCTVEGYQLALPEDVPCEPPQHEAGILWDAVCFTFLLIQRRIFLSYYHLYVVADLKATEALASRGAKWLELSLSKALEHCEEEEKKSRVFITRQMEKIKAKQKKIATLQPAGRSAQALAASTSHLPGREAARAAGVKESTAQRLVTMARLSWVLGAVLLDDVTEALATLSGEAATVATALRAERSAWWRAIRQPVQRDARPADGMDEDRATEPQSGHPHGSSPDSCKGERDGVLTTQPQEAPLPPEGPRMPWDDELQQSDRFYGSLPRLVKLTLALYQLAASKSEVLCYFVIVLNHTLSASVLSMVLPILSFLWAMLSVPRPSRRFWMAAIYYTEATVVVKYFSQFGFFPWTTKQYAGINREKPFSLPNILGIEKKDDFALCDLVQLLVLLFHRSTMEGLGLWDPPTSGQARCKKKSRKPRGGAGRGTPGSGHLGGQAERGHHSQQPPLQPSAHRRASGRGARGGGSRKRWRLFRKCHFSQNQLSRRTLKKQLEKARKLVIQRTLETFHSIRQFFYNVTHPEASLVCDVYTAIFLVETLNFAIILFGFWAFGKHTAVDLAESLSEDKVPETFLAMVLLQFGTMLVDRALYLRRTLRGKCALQVVLVLGTHCWLLVALPKATDRRFNLNPVAQLWYLVKCIYFGLSAYQIKCGYPQRIHGNFLTKNFNLCNLVLFKGFRFVPFLLELRAVIDWVWTDTALSLSNWVCLEDLYANIFIMKCRQESEKRYPQRPGQRKKRAVKYSVGGVLTLALVSLMWFPLVFMALLKTVGGVTNPPLDVSVRVAVDGYETLFSMRSQQRNLASFSDAAYDQLIQQYALHPSAMQFLANYRPEDVVLARIKSHSSQLWGISPADRAAMVEELANATRICVTVSWTIQSSPESGDNPIDQVITSLSMHHRPVTGGSPLGHLSSGQHRGRSFANIPWGLTLAFLLASPSWLTQTDVPFREEALLPVPRPRIGIPLPRFADTPPSLPVHSQRPQDVDRLAFFRNATVRLQRLGPPDAGSPPAEWWMVQEWRPDCDQHRGCSRDLELVVYSDKVSPPSLGFLAGYGIVGLYVSVVMVVAKFIREHFLGISRSIMFDELPSVDRVLRLCSDIFLVRELGELELEQQLFAKLVFLYRSPETMIKWTRQRPADPAGRPPPDPVAGAPAGLGEAAAAS